ncbi:thioredoxin-like 1-2, chloroplastic [Sesamum indicum]|uniref:Thioredoxin-like 1-2, chloroplastic n=1 Tax=Sesamum indicum TaxID=4182 RepID=A0A6I9SNP0_SESIN|nr:thioredoxin-like 1-2, chloroplastic [Sesamum indicum]
MSCSLKAVYGSSVLTVENRAKGSFRVCSSIEALQFKEAIPKEFLAKTLDASDQKPVDSFSLKAPKLDPFNAQPSLCRGKSLRWWEKSLHPNMIEIQSAQELVISLLNAGDRLVVLDFYSPGCGGCKTLHPKICQLAEMNSNAIFLKVNYEQHKPMCYALHVHVLPFFRFYKGQDGRLCSFSCTNATIKKFKDALAKHGNHRSSMGPTKGLHESELLALASNGLISRDLVMNSTLNHNVDEELVLALS